MWKLLMSSRRVWAAGSASLLMLAALPVVADRFDDEFAGSMGEAHGVYLGDGRILEASAPRQMTLRGHVMAFQYSPTGEKIAYLSLVVDHGEKSVAIKYVDPWRSEPMEISVAKSKGWGLRGQKPRDLIAMAGWSGDGRYLMVQRIAAAGDGALMEDSDIGEPPAFDVTYECYDTQGDLSSPQIIHLGTGASGAAPMFAWSPDRTQVLFAMALRDQDPAPAQAHGMSLIVYRPENNSQKAITGAAEWPAAGWLDDGSLLLEKARAKRGDLERYHRYVLATGAEDVIAKPDGWPENPWQTLDLSVNSGDSIDPKLPDLSLDVVVRKLPDSANQETVTASTIWVRSASEKKKYAAAPIGVTPGSDPPHPQWSPTGQAVAFLAHGDLFVTDFVKRVADAREKLEAGEKLDCAEERKIVQDNLKQIGLGLLQYTQDSDERLPPPSNVQDRISPYLKSMSVFTLGDVKFVYRGDSKMTLQSIDSPADFVIGEMDTPCAHNYLYLDGHVGSIAK